MMSRVLKAIPLGLLVGIAGLSISFFPLSHDLEEDWGLGLLFKLRGARPAPSDVVVVSIDKESSEHLNVPNNPDKWPRSLHARLVEKLAAQGAKVITFDVHFIEPRTAKDDNLFSAAIKKAGNVVLAEPLAPKEVAVSHDGASDAAVHNIVNTVQPIDLFARPAAATAPFVLPRIPFKVNQYWTFQTGAADSPTFPTIAFQLFAEQIYGDFIHLLEQVSPGQAKKLPRSIAGAIKTSDLKTVMREIRDVFESEPSLAERMLERLERSGGASTDARKQRLLQSLVKMYGGANRRYVNYYGPPRTVATLPFHQALQPGENGGRKPTDLKGKAVFVGLSEKLLAERKDSFYTVFSQANGVFIGGVEIAATAFSNLLEDKPVQPISQRFYILLILLGGVFVGVICRMLPMALAAPAVVVSAVVYLIAAEYRFKADGVWYPLVVPLFFQAPLGFFGAVLWNYVETNKERQRIRKALAFYVPDEVVAQLAKNIVDIKKAGQVVYGACLFTDAAGYTALSEKLNPQELSDFMHKYFETLFAPVKKHGGFVVDLKGDSILAVWKAAQADAALRNRACLAALDISRGVERFNRSYDDLDLPTRIGVHSGEIFLGNVGAGDHYEYRPTGDTVNTASRMDGLNKYLGTDCLVSEEVLQGLDGFLAREVGTFRFKGKAQPVLVHELVCRLEEAEQKEKLLCAIFAEALGAFKRRSWDEAKEKFEQAIENSATDGPTRFYLKLCGQYQHTPPEESWDGVMVLEEK
jgi:adenylate cyclase